jgi:hypothetical protein
MVAPSRERNASLEYYTCIPSRKFLGTQMATKLQTSAIVGRPCGAAHLGNSVLYATLSSGRFEGNEIGSSAQKKQGEWTLWRQDERCNPEEGMQVWFDGAMRWRVGGWVSPGGCRSGFRSRSEQE